jgi:hypothetical protein
MSRPKHNTEKLYAWLSPQINKWLTKKCIRLGIAKSEFIRLLLVRDMESGITGGLRGSNQVHINKENSLSV